MLSKKQQSFFLFFLTCFILLFISSCGPSGGSEQSNGTTSTTSTTTIRGDIRIGNVVIASLSPKIIADGVSTALIRATVYDTYDNLVPDYTKFLVSFSTTAGKLSTYSQTVKDGKAEVFLTSSTKIETANIKAEVGFYNSDYTSVQFIAGPPDNIIITATPSNLTADGISTSKIKIVVRDANDHLVADGEKLKIDVKSGTLNGTTALTVEGEALLTYTSPKLVPEGNNDTITVKTSNGKSGNVDIILNKASIGSVSVKALSQSIIADGVSNALIRATVSDIFGNPIQDNTIVSFITTAGTVSAETQTTKDGRADVYVKSPKKTGTANITATVGGINANASVQFIAGPPSKVTANAYPLNLTADGLSTSDVKIKVLDANDNLIDGEKVNLSIAFGKLNANSVTTVGGEASAKYTAPKVVPDIGQDTINAEISNGKSGTVSIRLISVKVGSIDLTSNTQKILADGTSKVLIRAVVKDPDKNLIADGTPVTFSTSDGSIERDKTTLNGIAETYLTSSKTALFATVTVSSGGISSIVSIEFIPGVPSKVDVTATPSNLTANGTSTSKIKIVVKDANGNLVADGEKLNISVAYGTLSSATATTAVGEASVTYTSPKSVPEGGDNGTDTISVRTSNAINGNKDINLNKASIGSVSITALSQKIIADGDSKVLIRSAVLDMYNNPVPDGTSVSFSTTAGTLVDKDGKLVASQTTKDGKAEVYLQSSTKTGTANITATAGGINANASVQFIPGPPYNNNVIVTADPSTLIADGITKSTIKAIVKDAKDNPVADGEKISFSLSNVNYGKLDNPSALTVNGEASVIYTSPTSAPSQGTVDIIAVTTNGISGSKSITLSGPQISIIDLTVDPTNIPADGVTKCTITAVVKQTGGGNAPDGTNVNFTIKKGGGTLSKPTSTTSNGVATTMLTSGLTAETVTIKAEAGGKTSEIQIQYTSGSIGISIIPDKDILGTGKEDPIAITATAKLVNGDPAIGQTIKFSLSDQSLGSLSPAEVLTDNKGQSITYFTGSIKDGTVTVTAKWTSGGQDISISKSIKILPPPAQISGGTANPTSVNVIGTGGQASSQISFEVKDSNFNYVSDGYRIDFSIESGPDGGEFINPVTAKTFDGKVNTILLSGRKSGPISIKATYYYNKSVNTTTSQLTISSGAPVGEEFGIAAKYLNISGLTKFALEDMISVNVGDVYGNPVPDNTAVSFKTYNTGGLIETKDALTAKGFAQKILYSTANPIPAQGMLSATTEVNNGGRTTHITSIAITPIYTNIIYAGTDGGGIYKSTDSGISWSNISRSSVFAGQNWLDPYINSIAISSDPNVIYAATGYLGKGNIYKSVDGGLNWNSNNPEQWNGLYSTDKAILTILCDDTAGSKYVWAGTEGSGIIYSTDGKNFAPALDASGNQLLGVAVRKIIKVNGIDTLFAATSSGVFTSIGQKGKIWTQLSSFIGNSASTITYCPNNPNLIYVGTQDSGVWGCDVTATNVIWTNYKTGLGKGLSVTVPKADSENYGDGIIQGLKIDGTSAATIGAATQTEDWIVLCVDVTDPLKSKFSVTGSVTGKLIENATAETSYLGAPNNFSFIIKNGSKFSFKKGDKFTFTTTKDPGNKIKDILVYQDTTKNKHYLYMITYFWGPLEPHAVGKVYSLELNSNGTVKGAAWVEANNNLPQYDPPADVTLFAQHALAVDNTKTPTVLFLGGEGINLLKALDTDNGITSGVPNWFNTKNGITNLIMARMPILFSGDCGMTVCLNRIDNKMACSNFPIGAPIVATTYYIYIQDSNGNPPISSSVLSVYILLSDGKTIIPLYDKTYKDSYINTGTYRDPSDATTDLPIVVTSPIVNSGETLVFKFDPLCQATAPGCSGSSQRLALKQP